MISPRLRVFALRFGVVFLALFVAPFPFDAIPKVGQYVDIPVSAAWEWLTARAGDLLGLQVVRHPSGSGDTLADYVTLGLVIVLALATATAWTLARPRVVEQPRLARWGRVALRYYLAATMVGYGLAKVFPSQFGDVADTNLYAMIGHKSPMGMLWTFMAASRPYQVFGGAMETMGGMLLLWRRTTLVGALVLLPVLTTVVALNFCYDVPVKLYSSLLLVGAVVLVVPDARRLIAAVFARTDEPVVARRWLRWVGKGAALAVFVGFALFQYATGDGGGDPEGAFGVWDVAQFARDGRDIPAGDAERWRVVGVRSSIMLRTADGEDHFYRVTRTDAERLEFGDPDKIGEGSAADVIGAFAIAGGGTRDVTLTGTFAGHAIVAHLHRADPAQMPLVAREFHWIQEYPYNR